MYCTLPFLFLLFFSFSPLCLLFFHYFLSLVSSFPYLHCYFTLPVYFLLSLSVPLFSHILFALSPFFLFHFSFPFFIYVSFCLHFFHCYLSHCFNDSFFLSFSFSYYLCSFSIFLISLPIPFLSPMLIALIISLLFFFNLFSILFLLFLL